MSNFKVDFIKDFFNDYPDKEVLRGFIRTLPLTKQEKKLLEIRYSDDKPMKVVAYRLGISERYAKSLHKDIIIKSLPFIRLYFIKALNTSLHKDN